MASSTQSNYLAQKEMNFLLKGEPWTPPATAYIALFTTVPQLDGTGGVEVSTTGTGYSRVAITQSNGWSGPSGTNQEYTNTADIVYNVPTGNWGTIVGVGIYDASTGGNLLFTGHLNTSKSVTSGDGAPKILAGQYRISRAVC